MLTQQELIARLKDIGQDVTSQTLRNREKQGLITPAYRGESGKPGRSVFYPDRCLWENYVASKLLNSSRLRLTAKQVKAAREVALSMEAGSFSWDKLTSMPEHEQLDFRLAEYWYAYFLHARYGFPYKWAANIKFVVNHADSEMEIYHSFDAITIDVKKEKIQHENAIAIYIDISTKHIWDSEIFLADLVTGNLIYIEVGPI